MGKMERAKGLMNRLNKLDAQYLTGYPSSIPRTAYVKRRASLRREFERLRK